MCTNAVQVLIIPAHEQLDDAVQIHDRQIVPKRHPAPNCGMNIPKLDLQL